jgi:hypothetical protein
LLIRPFARPKTKAENQDRKQHPACAAPKRGDQSALSRHHPRTSYWLSDANEMVAIKTFLIIVNSFVA